MDQVRHKQRSTGPKPDKLSEFQVDTEFLEEGFFAGDVQVDDARHLIFCTQKQLHLLQRSRKWYLDGTFKVVNKPFQQLWGIHALVKQGESAKQVPLVFVVMSRRRKQDYVAVLEQILELLDKAPAVECFAMDFEIGVLQALRQVKGVFLSLGPGCSATCQRIRPQCNIQRAWNSPYADKQAPCFAFLTRRTHHQGIYKASRAS